jgi:hypothetical protein
LVLRTLVLIPLTFFEKKRYSRQKFETVLPIVDFLAKKKKTSVNVALCILVVSWAIAIQKKQMFTLYCRKNNSIFMLCCKVLNSSMASHWFSSNYFSVVYFQAPYCNFCHYTKTCPHFIMYFTCIMSNIYWIYIYILDKMCSGMGICFVTMFFFFTKTLSQPYDRIMRAPCRDLF